jgi:ATP-dependent Lon protease
VKREESANLDERVKWHLLARMVPFVENNYNCCELGPGGTGKSHIYKEISRDTILISGGQTTVVNLGSALFYMISLIRMP